jgi:hypothetical protein
LRVNRGDLILHYEYVVLLTLVLRFRVSFVVGARVAGDKMKVGPVIRVYKCGEALSQYENENEQTRNRIRALGCVLRDAYRLYCLIDLNAEHVVKPTKIRSAWRAIVESQERTARFFNKEITDQESQLCVEALCASPEVSESSNGWLLEMPTQTLDTSVSCRHGKMSQIAQAALLTHENMAGWATLVFSIRGLYELQVRSSFAWKKTSILTTRYLPLDTHTLTLTHTLSC